MNPVSIISLCFSGIMMIVGVVTFVISRIREGKNDIEEENKDKEDMKSSLLELSYLTKTINQTTNDIKTDVKSLSSNMNEIDKRVIRLENEQATMWRRLDEVKDKVGV
jgi:chromosome segregation ATPase